MNVINTSITFDKISDLRLPLYMFPVLIAIFEDTFFTFKGLLPLTKTMLILKIAFIKTSQYTIVGKYKVISLLFSLYLT